MYTVTHVGNAATYVGFVVLTILMQTCLSYVCDYLQTLAIMLQTKFHL